MTDFIDDYETMEFPDQRRNDYESWVQIQIREPKSAIHPYNMEKYSIYLTMWEGARTGIFLTAKQARKIASWLINAAEIIDKMNSE